MARNRRSQLIAATVLIALTVVAVSEPLSAQSPGKEESSLIPGTLRVGTPEQAQRGKTTYTQHCAWCHGVDLEGATHGTPLTGDYFSQRWAGRTVDDLLKYTRAAMPPGKAGRFSTETYLQMVVHILRLNGYPAGDEELSFDPAGLQRIVLYESAGTAKAVAPLTGQREVKGFVPITEEMLLDPDPADWLMQNRTVDLQRFSPLAQINQDNVGQLSLAWARGMEPGLQETIPVVYDGVMYVANPGDVIQALDATTGDLIWEYRRHLPQDVAQLVAFYEISRSLAIYDDMVFHAAADGYIIALDARTGELRWETQAHDYKSGRKHTSGVIIADNKILSGRACPESKRCFIAAHDAKTGKALWRRYTTAAPGEPGGDSWGGLPVELRVHASPWGIPGSYDHVRKLVYWGAANPAPYTRIARHGGNPDAVSRSSPAELYSNSTMALHVETGEVAWYYQHLPGDDWDEDHVHERIMINTRVDPDPDSVKWINPNVSAGENREIVLTVGEPGGIWALDRGTGEFLWATPFPFDVPEFHISDIDVETGKTHLNWDLVSKSIGETHILCFHNTKGYWPMAYNPENNSVYIPYNDYCLQQTSNADTPTGTGPRIVIPRPGADPDALAGLAKLNVSTGRVELLHTQRAPSMAGTLVTAGNLVFWGDLDRRVRAFDADTGEVLWETILGDSMQNGPITYSVNGRQYVAVLTGWALTELLFLGAVPEIRVPAGHNAIYVFSLSESR